jgi:hypothetical protein
MSTISKLLNLPHLIIEDLEPCWWKKVKGISGEKEYTVFLRKLPIFINVSLHSVRKGINAYVRQLVSGIILHGGEW